MPETTQVWAFDRLARSVKHFLEVLDELTHLNIKFISFRENVDTSGPLGLKNPLRCGYSESGRNGRRTTLALATRKQGSTFVLLQRPRESDGNGLSGTYADSLRAGTSDQRFCV